jgi:hypothetical protein
VIYSIKLDGQEVARLTGDRIQFGKKMASSSLMERNMVDDRSILKQLDADGNVVWVIMLSHRNLTVEETG